jgi:hypothetical protein
VADYKLVPGSPQPRKPGRSPRVPANGQQTLGAEPANGQAPNGKPAKTNGSTFEQAFKNIDDVLRKEAGCTTELDYTEQTSWLLFLKYPYVFSAHASGDDSGRCLSKNGPGKPWKEMGFRTWGRCAPRAPQ